MATTTERVRSFEEPSRSKVPLTILANGLYRRSSFFVLGFCLSVLSITIFNIRVFAQSGSSVALVGAPDESHHRRYTDRLSARLNVKASIAVNLHCSRIRGLFQGLCSSIISARFFHSASSDWIELQNTALVALCVFRGLRVASVYLF